LTPEQNKGLADRPIQDPRAYESYLRARYAIFYWTPNAFAVAERELQKSLELQGENELLYATLGWVRVMSVEAGMQNEEFLQKAEECARAVLRLSPESLYASGLQGLIEYKRGNIQAAVVHLKRANMLTTNNPEISLTLSLCYCLAGRQSIALPVVENLLQIDPLTPMNYAVRGFLEYIDGRRDRAVNYYRKAFELGHEIPVFSLFYAWTLASDGQKDEATRVIDLLTAKAGKTLFARFGEIVKLAMQGNRDEMLATLTPEVQDAARQVEYSSRLLADCCALVGANTEAVNWLENDIRLGFFNYPFLMEYDTFLANIRSEPRFQKLMARVKYEWEHFEV
jgi:tetratricopeptide (TPR) repeat protein